MTTFGFKKSFDSLICSCFFFNFGDSFIHWVFFFLFRHFTMRKEQWFASDLFKPKEVFVKVTHYHLITL